MTAGKLGRPKGSARPSEFSLGRSRRGKELRRCLGPGGEHTFWSAGIGNRVCPRCQVFLTGHQRVGNTLRAVLEGYGGRVNRKGRVSEEQ